MIRDPEPLPDGEAPYALLEAAGITPESTQADVRDAAFTLMTRGLMNPATQAAADELRDPVRRLAADALLYDADLESALAQARERLERDRQAAAAPTAFPPPELGPELFAVVAADAPEPRPASAPEPELPGAAADFASPAVLDRLIQFDQ
ncbi:hypothetical protein AB0B28_17060 [Glycomyces sp. NPDC046736]|uniref:hypothetical protein n=1 Tax=Glycomyces sp. NPDC046736 TaxID=3155615 RepID=UPI00340B108B